MAWPLRAQALTGERRGRRPPHRLLAVDAHERALPHLRERCRQCLIASKIELAGEPRLPLHRGLQGCRSTDTTKNPPEACVRNQLPSKPVPAHDSALNTTAGTTVAGWVCPAGVPCLSTAHEVRSSGLLVGMESTQFIESRVP